VFRAVSVLRTCTSTSRAWAMETPTDIVGFAGGVVIALSLVPQIYRTLRTKSTKDISYGYQIVYIVGLAAVVYYSLAMQLVPVYIPAIFELSCILLLTALKIYFDNCMTPPSSAEMSEVVADNGTADDSAVASPIQMEKRLQSEPQL